MSKISGLNNMSLDTLRHARGYGWIYLNDEQLYQFIQELFPGFSIERLDELHRELEAGLKTFNSDQTLVYYALRDASEYEVYAEGTDVTISTRDELDLPYPYIEIPGGYSLILDNIDDVLSLLELDNILQFRPTNRNSFTEMKHSTSVKRDLPFNQELYKSKYSKIISLNKIYEHATNIRKHKNVGIGHVTYNMYDNIIKVDNQSPRKSTRKEYSDICLSMSQLL